MFLFQFIASLFSNLIPLVGAINNQAFPDPLTPEEEEYYLNQMAQGDKGAREKLIEHNLRLVAHIVKKYQNQSDDKEDLISIGTIGLIKAINSYNREKGTKLATYAARCIENEILMHFRNLRKTAQDVSISEPIDTDPQGNPLTLMDIIYVDDTIVDEIDLANRIAKLNEHINNLEKQRDKDILIMRYGLNGTKPHTQKCVAAALGISRSYVSRIEKRLLLELRAKLQELN